MLIRKIIPVLILGMILLAACGSNSSTASNSDLRVTASTTILKDFAQHVAGDRLQVESLVPPGADPHEYQAVPSDVQKIAESVAVIVNGLGYELFIQPLLDNAGGEHLVIVASDGLKARQMKEASGETVDDPHMWMSPTRVIQYVENIRSGLAKVDPGGADVYRANAEAYISQLKELDSWIRQQVAQIPPERRLLVTNHDSLGYFAEDYGFRVIGTVVPGVSSEAAPSAQQLAALIDDIKATGAPAVFLNVSDNPQLADQVAAETNVTVISDLYIETLSTSKGPAATYIDMMKYNVSKIVEALK